MEYLEWLDALKMLKPTISCSIKCLNVFSSLVMIYAGADYASEQFLTYCIGVPVCYYCTVLYFKGVIIIDWALSYETLAG